ncbi:uncharacterized protein LOC131686035 [Topomyia yanbarensis]|uniref:uncharacterized protein LOC131686035 n=1 Tax=Topomyia yanbarensis TaxID=2498891 RepID=UPI00273BCD1A|nr:uncharacterized protein LOC131686035 [Topomyia yanbarensis]
MATQNLYTTIDEMSFGRKRETFCELRNFYLERTEEEYKMLIKSILDTGQDVAASRAFFLNPGDRIVNQESLESIERLEKISMMTHYEESFKGKTLSELRVIGKTINWNISQADCDLIESMTREQSSDPMWFKLRFGRITASNFARCVRTTIENPSKSLLKTIFGENQVQNVPALLHGRRNEAKGVIEAIRIFKFQGHTNVTNRKSGLVIAPKYPYFAASPDQIVQCDCCGVVVVEVKCPFNFDLLNKEEGINMLLHRQQPYIRRDNNGNLEMCHSHPYYYQVQMQTFLTGASYGIFLVWAPRFSVFVKVDRNEEFWNIQVPKAQSFFLEVLAPEIIGRYYSTRF